MHHRDTDAWQQAMNLVDGVYDAVATFPKYEWFGLAQQMRDAAVSIPSNIAEGEGRGTQLEHRKFLHYARGSLFEIETQVLIAARRNYVGADTRDALLAQTERVAKLVHGLLRAAERRLKNSR